MIFVLSWPVQIVVSRDSPALFCHLDSSDSLVAKVTVTSSIG